MSEDEINQKVREAENYAEEDQRFKELTEAKNHGEALIYQTEKLLKENESVIGDLKSNILEKISDLVVVHTFEMRLHVMNFVKLLKLI